MTRQSLLSAVREGLRAEMRRDPLVWVLGEDVGSGGLYGQYAGFRDEFGAERVVSTPISEATIMGAGLGAALAGTRPVIEMRISDFALCAADELVNQIAKARYMFGGQARAPLVVRMPHGIVKNSAAQHSQSLEAWYVHVPGLVVLAPATPADAQGLLIAAVRCDDPVVFFEARAFWAEEDEVPDGFPEVPIGKARIARAGSDVTVVAWSSAVPPALAAAGIAAGQGIEAEVIDLRSLWPWDREAVLASVARTGRLVIAQEGVVVGGFGAEIAATVGEELGDRVGRAVRRVGAPRAPVPYSPPLEDAVRLDEGRIARAIAEVVMPAHTG
jgi:acetoin:2,6-dichlorophenolindophenol oxidoreductase subunit beta